MADNKQDQAAAVEKRKLTAKNKAGTENKQAKAGNKQPMTEDKQATAGNEQATKNQQAATDNNQEGNVDELAKMFATKANISSEAKSKEDKLKEGQEKRGQIMEIIDSIPKTGLIPKMLTGKIASSTRDITTAEKEAINKKLEYVVIKRDLLSEVEQCAAQKLAESGLSTVDKRRNDGKLFVSMINPELNYVAGLTPIILSEQDTRDWFSTVIGRPATIFINSLMRFLKNKRAGGTKDTNILTETKDITTFLVSAAKLKHDVIPDMLLCHKSVEEIKKEEHITDNVKCVVEFKTANAYNEHVFDFINETTEEGDYLYENHAVPFIWPGVEGNPESDRSSKHILQVSI